MVSPLLLSRGLRKEENNEKKRKRVKRNEIQCMILLKSLIFGSTKSEVCLKKEYGKYVVYLIKIIPATIIFFYILKIFCIKAFFYIRVS